MYILNRRRKTTRSLLLLGLLVVGVGVGAFAVRDMFRSETTIGPAPAAVISTVTDGRPKSKVIDSRLYTFELPGDWESFTPTESLPVGAQSWRNTIDNKGVRVITVYTDVAVQNIAVNRVLAVQAMEGHMSLAGEVSDNCINFTNPGKQPTGNAIVKAKWQSVEFLCDTGNYVRNLVGLGAPGGINGIKLSGPAAGQHTIFMTYNDASASPDFGIFTAMVQSFKLK